MPGLISDEVLEEICVTGTPAEAARLLHHRCDGIADRVALSLPYRAAPGLLEDFLGKLRT